MSFQLQQLDFIVSLIDKVSGPAGKLMTSLDSVTTNIQKGYQKIGYGAAGLVGAGYSINSLIDPTKQMNRAIGEVQSLDVANDAMQALTQTALQFSGQYGESATDFVRASYDIQSAIGGLAGNELAKFTEASAILAKGTKADTATVTSYVGTMYGIFKNNADAMGKAEWVQQLAGQTATAVQMFKTTGAEMSGAFGNLGAEATTHGIAMNEQMAILGQLQATMSGTEAGTKYKSFLAGVGKAQEALGLQFTDSQGKMLPIIDILGKIQGKFGAIDTVAESDLLQKAFGRKEAVGLIKLLSTDIEGLSGSINALGQNTGMEKAVQMATAIADPFEQAGAKVDGLQIKLGNAMMPAILGVLSGAGALADTLMRWSELFPNLTEYVGYAVLGIVGLIAAFSALSIIMGVLSFASAGFGLVMAIITSPITLIVLGVGALIGLIAAAVIYWDEWTQAVIDFTSPFLEAIGLFDFADGLIEAWDALPQWFTNFAAFLAKLNPFSLLIESVNWLLDKLRMIPGLDVGGKQIDTKAAAASPGLLGQAWNWISGAPEAPQAPTAPVTVTPRLEGGTSGGVINRISNATSHNNRSMGDLIVNNYGQAPNIQQLADDFAMVAP